MSGQEGITREEIHHDLFLGVDLDYLDTLIGKQAPDLGIPIFHTAPYSPPPGCMDKYESLRKWYRRNLETYGALVIIHRRDLQRILAKAQHDAVDYLVTEDANERAAHEGWDEPGNEAVEIEHWIFPADAVDHATVTLDFIFENIKVTVTKLFKPVAEIYYSVDRKQRLLYYSGVKKLKTPV